MAESALGRELAIERAQAIGALLARPTLDAAHHPAEFTAVVRHGSWLIAWFDTACGWQLRVDRHGSFARLHKRRHRPDTSRALRRPRGNRAPFDRRRFELLCRICAELISPPITTVGLLAQRLEAATTDHPVTERFDTTRRSERSAFVDCLLVLSDFGAVTLEGGDVDAYVDDADGNAFVHTDVARIHILLSSETPPSRLTTSDPSEATVLLGTEGRFALDEGVVETEDRRNQRLRQSIARRLLDDPSLYRHEMSEDELAYLDSLSGRRWLSQRADEAGMRLEVRAEGALCVDLTGRATDLAFPSASGNVWQVALLLVDQFVLDSGDRRSLVERTRTQLAATVAELLRSHPKWARKYRDAGGPETLTAEAIEVLAAFRLVDIEGQVISPLPAIARYRVGAMKTAGATLFDPEES